jgi:hypothetical protein
MIDFCQQCAHPKENGSREPEVSWMCATPQVGLYHISKNCVSGMGGPVQAIRLINQNQLLLDMVGINIILSIGNEYVKLTRNSLASHGGRIGISYIRRNSKQLKKQENRVHIEVLCILESQF